MCWLKFMCANSIKSRNLQFWNKAINKRSISFPGAPAHLTTEIFNEQVRVRLHKNKYIIFCIKLRCVTLLLYSWQINDSLCQQKELNSCTVAQSVVCHHSDCLIAPPSNWYRCVQDPPQSNALSQLSLLQFTSTDMKVLSYLSISVS